MRYRILGPLEVESSAGPVRLDAGRPRAVLAFLLAHRNAVVGADLIADALWGEEPPATWRTALQVHVSNLRKALGPEARLLTRRDGYVLEVGEGEVDADAFLATIAEARQRSAQHRSPAAALLYGQALALWRGPPLAGTALEDDFPGGALLTETWAAALEERGAALLATNDHAQAIVALTEAVTLHPFRERLRELLILALYRAGRQEEALAAYRDAHDTLLEELGVDPSPALQRLEAAILDQDPALLPFEAAGTASAVPVPATRTVGREDEIARLSELFTMANARLVTLIGPGGVGKTRLATEASLRLAPLFSHGAALVSLAEVDEARGVAAALARQLGVRETVAGAEADLVRALKDREMLVVLDNLEQLLPAAPLVAKLLTAAPGLSILATSREALGLSPERLFPVGPLPWDGGGSTADAPAVALFADRARAVSPSFTLDQGNVATVSQICSLLDGLPLGIELAAARLETFSLSELHAELADVLSLTSRDADRPGRHRGLEAALRWSWELLTEDEQYMATCLSVFVGSFGRADAVAVARGVGPTERAAMAALESLVRKSLVVRRADFGAGSDFALLQTVRAFSARELELSGRESTVRAAHIERMLVACGGELAAPFSHSLDWYRWMTAHYTDVMAAVQAASRSDRAAFFRFIAGLSAYWSLQAYFDDGERWTSLAISIAETDEEHALSLVGASQIVPLRGHRTLSVDYREEALRYARQAESPALCAAILSLQGNASMIATDYLAGRRYCEEALVLLRDSPAAGWEAFAMSSLARIATIEGDSAEARRLLQAMVEVAELWGFDDVRLASFSHLGEIARLDGDLDLARDRYHQALEIARGVGALRLIAVCLENLVYVERSAGNADAMRSLLLEAFPLARELQQPVYTAGALASTAGYAALAGEPERGARLLGRWRTFQAEQGPLALTEQMEVDRDVAALRRTLGDDAFEKLAAEGERLTLAEAIDLATSILGNCADRGPEKEPL